MTKPTLAWQVFVYSWEISDLISNIPGMGGPPCEGWITWAIDAPDVDSNLSNSSCIAVNSYNTQYQ